VNKRAVFDTNVVVSTLVFGRRLLWLRRVWADGTIIPIVCRESITELLRVLAYPKFRLDASERELLLADYLPYSEVVSLPDPCLTFQLLAAIGTIPFFSFWPFRAARTLLSAATGT
jgi:hypothetical protein